MQAALQATSEHFPLFIGVLAGLNLLLWGWLLIYSAGRKTQFADFLFNAVRTLSRQSDIASNMSIDERINVFMADIRDSVHSPGNTEQAQRLLDRLMTKDEARLYLKAHRFEVGYSVARTCIEVFPLLGIVGTVLAIAAAMGTSGIDDSDKVSKVVQNFGHSVISTAVGLGAAIVFMFVNSLFEPGFERLLGYADAIRDMVAHAKKNLGLTPTSTAEMAK